MRIGAVHDRFFAFDIELLSFASRTSILNPPGGNVKMRNMSYGTFMNSLPKPCKDYPVLFQGSI